MNDDENTPPQRPKHPTLPPGPDDPANNFDGPVTAKVRLLLAQELPEAVQTGIKSEWNGTFATLKKTVERGKLIFTVVMTVVGTTWGIGKWDAKLARRDEVPNRAEVEVLKEQVKAIVQGQIEIKAQHAALVESVEILKKKKRGE